MVGYKANIEELTLKNEFFRQVLFTGKHCQLVLMNLLPAEEIGMEVHDTVDQFFRFEAGKGKVIMDGEENEVAGSDVVIVPAGTQHNIINVGNEPLKLYTIYSPPNHPDGTIHKTKAEAMKGEHHEG